MKEAAARIKINKLLEAAGWRFPPLAMQRAIVAEIEAEQKLVASNRELVARFEQKIQATLARIWGEEQPAAATAYPEPASAEPLAAESPA